MSFEYDKNFDEKFQKLMNAINLMIIEMIALRIDRLEMVPLNYISLEMIRSHVADINKRLQFIPKRKNKKRKKEAIKDHSVSKRNIENASSYPEKKPNKFLYK